VFDAETIARMAGHFQSLLNSAANYPGLRIGDIPILSAAESRQLMDRNRTASPYPRHRTIGELFESQAEASPEPIAVECGPETLTYRELNERSNRLARYLRDRGVRCEEMVAVCFEPGLDIVVALVAILKVGAAYVPLNPGYPVARLSLILDETRTRFVLTQTALIGVLPAGKAEPVCLDRDWPEISRAAAHRLERVATSENLAYVIYTSGSTGEPKGIAVSHRAVIRLLFHTNYVSLNAADRIAQVSRLAFDAITFEVWGARPSAWRVSLRGGSRAIPVPDDGVRHRTVLSGINSENAQRFRAICYHAGPQLMRETL
jgi:non-ribosomal peptide synthetase component F